MSAEFQSLKLSQLRESKANPRRRFDAVRIAWAAGLFDGEGSIGVQVLTLPWPHLVTKRRDAELGLRFLDAATAEQREAVRDELRSRKTRWPGSAAVRGAKS